MNNAILIDFDPDYHQDSRPVRAIDVRADKQNFEAVVAAMQNAVDGYPSLAVLNLVEFYRIWQSAMKDAPNIVSQFALVLDNEEMSMEEAIEIAKASEAANTQWWEDWNNGDNWFLLSERPCFNNCWNFAEAGSRSQAAFDEWPSSNHIGDRMWFQSHNERCKVAFEDYGSYVYLEVVLADHSEHHRSSFVAAFEAVKELGIAGRITHASPSSIDELPSGDLVTLWESPFLKVSQGDKSMWARGWKSFHTDYIKFRNAEGEELTPTWYKPGVKGPFEPFAVGRDQHDLLVISERAYDALIWGHEGDAELLNKANENRKVLERFCGPLF